MTPRDARSLAYDQLADRFQGSGPARIQQAAATAVHLESVLASIDAGTITATATEIARLEGADLALRLVSRSRI